MIPRMGRTRTDEFRKDAVRIALTSGLTRKQVADDLGVGMSTLNKWITQHRHRHRHRSEATRATILARRVGAFSEIMPRGPHA